MRPFSIPERLILGLILPLSLVACRREDPVEPTPAPPVTTGTVKVVVKPTWEGEPFVRNAEYINVSGYRVKVEDLRFFLGNVTLSNAGSSAVVRDVETFDMRHNGDTVQWSGVQPGTWRTLRAGLGVPQALNRTNPSEFPTGHPLSVVTYGDIWWSWAMGYKFVQFLGRYGAPDSTDPLITGFVFHTGPDICYQEFELDLGEVTVTAGNTTTIVLGLAVDRFFHGSSGTVDLATENAAHGNDIPLALKMTRNMIESFSVE